MSGPVLLSHLKGLHMNAQDFVYWLQGYFELSDSNTLTEKQVMAIKNHLNLVFTHVIDPAQVSHLPPELQAKASAELQAIHDGKAAPSINPIKGPPLHSGKGPFDPSYTLRC